MKRILSVLIIIPLLLQISCHRESANENALIYWSSNNSDEIIFANRIVETWNKRNPDKLIKVQPVPEGQSSEEVILAAVVGETTPDIYSNMWQGDVELYARAGRLIALDSIPGFMEFLYSRCDSSVIEEVRSTDGHIYQVPWKINPIMLIYNKKLFDKIGFQNPPATYNEFTQAARTLREKTSTKWIGYAEVIPTWWQRFFDFYPLYLAASGGAPLIKNNKVAFNNEYAVKTFAFLKKLFDNGYFPRERISARQDPFLAGDIATRFTGPWEIAHAEKFKPEGFEYGYTVLPVPDDFKGNIYTYGDTKNIVFFNTIKNKIVAAEFIMYMLKQENEIKLLEITTQFPRRKDLTTNPLFVDYIKRNPKMEIFARQAKYVKGPDNSPVLKEVFDIISQEYEASVIYSTKSPEQAVNDAAEAVSLLLLK